MSSIVRTSIIMLWLILLVQWVFTMHNPHCKQVPDFFRVWGHVVSLDQLQIKIGSFQFLPTGLHGLCFGCCFSGPLPLHSLTNGPPIGVHFRKPYTKKLTRSPLALKLSVSPPYYPWVTATKAIFQTDSVLDKMSFFFVILGSCLKQSLI